MTSCLDWPNCVQMVAEKGFDIALQITGSNQPTWVALPFTTYEYSIFYKAGEFHLSPTYFIDGLSTQLWIFIWSFFFLFFIGLLISVKVYQKYFSLKNISVGDIAMYEMNFVTNQSHKLPTNKQEKFLSWRIQMICQSAFNIIIACAFSTFILALLSIKTTDEPFRSLNDFAVKRTHFICDYSLGPTKHEFMKNDQLRPEFEGIYNTESNNRECFTLLVVATDELLCKMDNFALITYSHRFKEYFVRIINCKLILLTLYFRVNFETCPIIEVKDIFPEKKGSFFIRSNFKHRQVLNRMLIQMQSAGVVKRQEKFRTKLKKNYEAKREFKVYSEGVQFEHVRYIVYGYSFAVLLAFLVVVLENIYYRIKINRRSGQDQNEKNLENVLKGFSVPDEDLLDEIIDSLQIPYIE